jgi:transitional endoplasmic reticulum ATPase
MGEQDPGAYASTPEIDFFLNDSSVEIFNVNDIVAKSYDAPQRIFESQDIGGTGIRRAYFDTVQAEGENGEPALAMQLTANMNEEEIKLVKRFNRAKRTLQDASSNKFYRAEPSENRDDTLEICTIDNLRLVAHFDVENAQVIISNNMHLSPGNATAKEISPRPFADMTADDQLQEFGQFMVEALDVLSAPWNDPGHRLQKPYHVGKTFHRAEYRPNDPNALHALDETESKPPSIEKSTLLGLVEAAGRETIEPPAADPEAEPLYDIDGSHDWLNPKQEERVTFNDIGGNKQIVETLKEIQLLFGDTETAEIWGDDPIGAILLHGPQGTGKTMMVKALANELGADRLDVDCSELYDSLLGNSLKKVKALFEKIRTLDNKTVVFFDEFDSIFNSSDNSSGNSAESERNGVAGIFKTEMSKLANEKTNVLIAAATNRADKIDPALIRSERFDYQLYVPLPDKDALRDIYATKLFTRMTRNHRNGNDMDMASNIYSDEFDLVELAKQSYDFTGSDIESIIKKTVRSKRVQHRLTNSQPPVISQSDILQQIQIFRTNKV